MEEKTYFLFIDTSACMGFTCKAKSEEEAIEKAEEFIQSDDFFKKYREGCDFFEPTVADTVIEEE